MEDENILNIDIINKKAFDFLRTKRNIILNETDKYLISDYPILPYQLNEIKNYRQLLRDLPLNNFQFPIKPNFIN